MYCSKCKGLHYIENMQGIKHIFESNYNTNTQESQS